MKKNSLLLLTLLSIFSLTAQTDKDKVTETVSKATIEGHIYFLTDDLLKGRETGTPECKIAASYLANTLRSYGVKPNPKTGTFYQEVKLKKTSPPSNVSVIINGETMPNHVVISSAELKSNDKAMYLGYGLKSDYDSKDVTGKIVIIKSGFNDLTRCSLLIKVSTITTNIPFIESGSLLSAFIILGTTPTKPNDS